jgi:predicted dehydrogenase
LGIYCIQAACYLTGQEPLAVTARQIEITDNEKFIDIEEKIVWQMEMPDGIVVNCESSYSEEKSFLAIETSEGWFSLEPAFDYTGINLTTSDGNKFELPVFYQQAKQLDGIAMAIQNNEPAKVPGYENYYCYL